jgi:outer membrane receptor protein involved in Fe transport
MYSGEIEWSHGIGPQLLLTAAVYTNYVRNLISLQSIPPTPDGLNVQYQNTTTPVATTGAELEARRDWKEGFMVAASYSFQRSIFVASGSLGDLATLKRSSAYREVPNSPMHMASIRAAVPILPRTLSAMSRLSVEGPRFDINDQVSSTVAQTQTPSAVVWDLVLTGVETRWNINYSLGVYNVLDCQAGYPVSNEFLQTSIPMTGRTFLASASVTF